MSAFRLQRYLLREISVPTGISLVIFTFVLLMGRIPRVTELVVSKGIPVSEIFSLFAYLLPTFFSITLPLSFLLGILLAFGRFSADSEYIAIRASGISLYRLVVPVVLMSTFFVLLTGLITNIIEPASKAAFRAKLFSIASNSLDINIKPGVFNDSFDGIMLYTRGYDDKRGIMQDLFISDERNSTAPTLITAQEGVFIPDPNNLHLTLRLKDGHIQRQPDEQSLSTYQTIRFNAYDINIDTATTINNKKRQKRSEMGWVALNRAIESSPDGSKKRRLIIEQHERAVIAFAPLVLVLVGIPLGLQSQRSGKGAGFALALTIFLIYYVLLSFSGTIAEKGVISPKLILWLPNFCFLVGGLYFLHNTAYERPLKIVSLPRKAWHMLTALFQKGARS